MRKKSKKTLGILASVAAVTVFAFPAFAGTLEPPASAVDAAGNPVPTTQTPPSRSQKLPAAERFVLVLDDQAVLDRETGLVWEKAPSTNANYTWQVAIIRCAQLVVGNRGGWRLPTVDELASLVDYSVTTNPRLSPGHPFTGVLSFYWSSSEYESIVPSAWRVNFSSGVVDVYGKANYEGSAWCVR